MNDKQKIVIFILALLCNFTFLATANATGITGKALPECGSRFGADSMETKRNMAALQDDYSAKNFSVAYNWWHYVFTNAPCSYKSIYQYGPAIITNLIDKPEYASRRNNLIDTLFMCYEAKFKYFPTEAFPTKGNLALNINKYKPSLNDKALEYYRQYVDENKEKGLEPAFLTFYMKTASDLTKENKYSLENSINLYEELSMYVSNEKSKTTDTTELKKWVSCSNNLDGLVKVNLTCEKIDALYQPKLKATPNDKALITLVLKLYDMRKCNNNPNYLPLVEKSFEMEPNAQAAEMLGNNYRKLKNADKMILYFEKAAELSTDNTKKEEYYIILADAYVNKSPSQSRVYANKALDINPNNGKAMIYIGMAIYKTACGDKFDKAMHACISLDYFNRAKNADPSVAALANKNIATYSKYVPLKSDAFFRNLKNGDSYTIPCSGLTATVKTR